MTVSTFYPDASPEITSVDGETRGGIYSPVKTWADLIAGAGTTVNDSGPNMDVRCRAAATTDRWDIMDRVFVLFDTASIPDGDTIDSATLEFVSRTGSLADNFSQSLSLVLSTPASNTEIVAADHIQRGTVRQAPDITFASLTVDSATYNVMTLNATGRGNVSKTGVTKFGLTSANDIDAVSPTWANQNGGSCQLLTADEDVAGDKRPKLVVTHTSPPSTFVPRAIVF